MRYSDEDAAFIIDDDTAFPVRFFINESSPLHMDDRPQYADTVETRVVRGTFENRWSLSIIWGSMTYGTNKDHPWGMYRCTGDPNPPVFVEEPDHVEVGIIMPEPLVKPAYKIELPEWKGPPEFPEHEVELWGDPIGWVDAPQLRWLIGIVSRFNSHTWRIPSEGPYIENDDGYRLAVEFEDAPTREEHHDHDHEDHH
jgi:hypothetical protein